MNAFWLWFWRPIAEILGVLAVLAVLALLAALLMSIEEYIVSPLRRWWAKRSRV